MTRVAFFFKQARQCIRLARGYEAGPARDAILKIARSWRDLAKDTRARNAR